MSITALHHVQLAMPPGGEAAARRFYGELLGIPEVPKPAHLADRGGCWFERGVLKVHLGIDRDFQPATKAHPAFVVTDLAALVRVLEQAGFPARDGEPLSHWKHCYLDDPFGNRIELMEAESA